MKAKRIISAMLVGSLGLSLMACGNKGGQMEYDFTVNYNDVATADISSKGVAVHDPSIFEGEDGQYYIFGSHMTAAKSSDLLNWEMIADKYTKTNPVYGQVYEVQDQAFAWTGMASSEIKTDDKGTHVWAPAVVYNKTMGKYCMYYCTSSTFNASTLCFGTADAPEGPYTWQKSLIFSGFTGANIDKTDVLDYVDEAFAKKNYVKGGQYNYEDYPNAIDPTVFYDEDDRMWMVYGSWSGGIYLLEIDPSTGDVIHPVADEANRVDAYFGKKLLGGGHISIEGPWITYDKEQGYYYLYVSYGGLAAAGGYQIRVFRSETVDGDYVDMNGQFPERNAFHENFGLKLSGNYKIPSLEKAYMATGHNSQFKASDSRDYVVFHTRFNNGTENHSPRVHQMLYNQEGWPCMLPYQTQGETVSETGYSMEEMSGRYFFVDQGEAIDADIANPKIIYLNQDGTVKTEEEEGTWEAVENSYMVKITIGEKEYSGVFCAMKDEAGTDCMTFSIVGSNHSLWGIKY